jgi:hypothetical protein
MVISYNHNLYFKIQCRKSIKKNDNSFPYIFYTTENSHNNMNMKITTETCTFLVYWKLKTKYNKKNSCFVEMKSNNKIKYVVYQKQNM